MITTILGWIAGVAFMALLFRVFHAWGADAWELQQRRHDNIASVINSPGPRSDTWHSETFGGEPDKWARARARRDADVKENA